MSKFWLFQHGYLWDVCAVALIVCAAWLTYVAVSKWERNTLARLNGGKK